MPKNLPKISIITPTLNQANFIEQTIKSVVSQNYTDLEYIVIDGGSTDGTLDILKKYSGRLKWISEKDRGQAEAINKGVKMSSGDIIGYLNSDDVLAENCLLKVAKFFTTHNDIFWVTGKCFIIDSQNKRIRGFITWYKNILLRFFRSSHSLIITNFISQPATFWRRSAMEKTEYFNESLHYSMDYEYWLRLWKEYKPGFIDDYLASFRVHKQSKTAMNLSLQQKENGKIILKYTKSGFLLNLHCIHDKIISLIY